MLIPYRSVRTPCRKETEIKKSIFIAVKNAQLDCKIIVPLEHHLT